MTCYGSHCLGLTAEFTTSLGDAELFAREDGPPTIVVRYRVAALAACNITSKGVKVINQLFFQGDDCIDCRLCNEVSAGQHEICHDISTHNTNRLIATNMVDKSTKFIGYSQVSSHCFCILALLQWGFDSFWQESEECRG